MVSYLFCPGHGGGVRWKKGDEKYEVSDHPMYTCSLEGCKSAWGTSDDIFNHCIKPKHHKNFFKKLNPDDTRIAGLSSADVGLTLARRKMLLRNIERRWQPWR